MTLDLRPLTLGELFDRAFTLYRRNLWLFVGITAVPSVLALAMTITGQIGQMLFIKTALAGKAGQPPDPAAFLTAFGLFGAAAVLMVVYIVLYMVALGATTFAVSEVNVGRRVTIAEMYGKMRGRVGALVRLALLIGVRMIGLMIAAGVFMGLAIGLSALISPIVAVVAGGLSLIMFIGLVVLWVYLVLRWAVCVPALVIERLGARASLKRSIELTKGRRGRVFLLLLCATIVTYATVVIFQGPFIFGSMMATPGTAQWLWMTILGGIVGTIGATFTTPFLIIGLALLYYDARMRDEGLDLELALAALDAPAGA